MVTKLFVYIVVNGGKCFCTTSSLVREIARLTGRVIDLQRVSVDLASHYVNGTSLYNDTRELTPPIFHCV